jgi:hypothetical protein
MLKTEAQWLGARLASWPTDRGVVVNVGSSNYHFRTKIQPWIEHYVLSPARTNGLTIVNQDLFPGEGIDIAGDFLSDQCMALLRQFQVYGVICSNVLEHVLNPAAFAKALWDVIPPSGRALVTVPYRFPYHADPIDTGYRPNISELLSLFPESQIIRAEIVRCRSLFNLVRDNPLRALSIGFHHESRRNKSGFKNWLPYLVRAFKITCVEIEFPESV